MSLVFLYCSYKKNKRL